MSIYGTWWSADDDDHADGCDYWAENEIGVLTKSGKPCSLPDKCVGSPYIYQGSHVLPKEDDPRGGYVLVCAIPEFIHRDGRDEEGLDELHDYLRLSVGSDANSQDNAAHAVVLLTRKQVVELQETLAVWLARSSKERKDHENLPN